MSKKGGEEEEEVERRKPPRAIEGEKRAEAIARGESLTAFKRHSYARGRSQTLSGMTRGSRGRLSRQEGAARATTAKRRDLGHCRPIGAAVFIVINPLAFPPPRARLP